MPLTSDLSNSVVVITGAGSGVGSATAQALSRRGARVVLAGRRASPLSQVAEQCRMLGSEAVPVPTDVADPEAVERLADVAEDSFGRVDAWINNAAVAVFGRLMDAPLDDLRRSIEIDLMGYLYGARTAVPRLRSAGGGVLVMVSSVLGEVSVPYLGSYNIAKHGVLGLCDTLRQELRSEGVPEVSVSAVLPSSIDTPLFNRAANYTGRAVRPVPPVNPPERIANRIVRVLESPRRQVYAGLGAAPLGWQWRVAPGLTERLLAWYGRNAQFQGDRRARHSQGNVVTSDGATAQLTGGWRSRDD